MNGVMTQNYDRLVIRDGLLVRSYRQKRRSFPDYAIVVPKAVIPNILKGIHDCPFAGHLGITRMSVEEYISACVVCSQHNQPHTSGKAPLKPIEIGEPFTFWAMDYMGPLPETSRGTSTF